MQEGVVQVGNPWILEEKDPQKISVAFANRIYHHDRRNREGIESVLAVPALSESWQLSLRKMREKCS
jgi:MOSC domain-containing protein YiiM